MKRFQILAIRAGRFLLIVRTDTDGVPVRTNVCLEQKGTKFYEFSILKRLAVQCEKPNTHTHKRPEGFVFIRWHLRE